MDGNFIHTVQCCNRSVIAIASRKNCDFLSQSLGYARQANT
jgi:hypothetical protein